MAELKQGMEELYDDHIVGYSFNKIHLLNHGCYECGRY